MGYNDYNLLLNGVYWGYNPFTTIDPNFLGHPSRHPSIIEGLNHILFIGMYSVHSN